MNVLLFMSDEHHSRYTGVGGHPTVRSPNIDRLAQRGCLFEAAYCPSPLCSPSRSSFAAGRRVHQLQWYNNSTLFPRRDPTYGGVLSEQNVHTVYIGKTHLYRPIAEAGFSEVIEAPAAAAEHCDRSISRHPLTIRAGAAARANGFGVKADASRTDDLRIAAALQWLNETAPTLRQPWTLSVNLSFPHFPHFVSEELWEMYADAGDLPLFGRDEDSARHPRARDLRDYFQTDQFTDEQIRGLRRGYLGCVTYVDRQLGKLLDALQSSGRLDDTLVIYTSDHGDMLGKFGMWWKCSLYEDSVRVPLVIAGPGFAAGRRVQTPVDLLDVQATIFRALGASRPESWIGTPLQQIPLNDMDRVVFSEYHGHGTRASSYLVRRGKMKLIYHVGAPHQLFDLAADPEELRNLAGDRPRIMKELEGELRKICDPEKENDRAEAMIQKQLAACGEG